MKSISMKSKVIALASLLVIGGAGMSVALVHQPHVSAASNEQGSEQNDGETNDDAKASAADVQDNGQDGEAADSANQ